MKTIGYVRVSHLESLNGESFETQSKKITQYSELKDFSVTSIENEVISGGVEIRKRKSLSKIVEKLVRGDRLIVARLDRLSRNILDTLKFVNECKTKGIEIHIVDLGCVTNGGVGQIVLNILTCLAETERIQISERIKAQKHYAKKERKFLGGAMEFGYRKDDKGKYQTKKNTSSYNQCLIFVIKDLVTEKSATKLKRNMVVRFSFNKFIRL